LGRKTALYSPSALLLPLPHSGPVIARFLLSLGLSHKALWKYQDGLKSSVQGIGSASRPTTGLFIFIFNPTNYFLMIIHPQLQTYDYWENEVYLEAYPAAHCCTCCFLVFIYGVLMSTQLLAEDNSILARVSRSPTTTALEVTRLALQLNFLHPCIVAAALFLSGRHID
jgi:hypothetical protein